MSSQRPTGIIRTLPNLYADRAQVAHDRMKSAIGDLSAGRIPAVYIALSQKPKIEVLHMYLVIGNAIFVRMNIASYEPGERVEVECWDKLSRSPKWWAVCTGPVSYPSREIHWRGFQGIRYTEDLW